MKNNTKLIMENWRKFLKEGPADEGDYTGLDDDGLPLETQDLVDEMPGELPPVGVDEDPDLEGYMHDIPRDSSARDAWQGSEGAYADVIETGGSDEDAVAAAEDYWNESGYNLDDEDYDLDNDGNDFASTDDLESLDTDY